MTGITKSAPDQGSQYSSAMRRASELALNGPRHDVNPQVGCVILDAAGAIIAEGWHRGSGTPHAEIDALSKLSPEAARGATVVVSLEPCNHHGRTGPCAEALVAAGVARVVYAVSDTGAESSGGAATLRTAGIEVHGGVLAGEVSEQLAEWMTSARFSRPHVTVKWAQSLDGRIAAEDGSSQWITSAEARARVHEQRSQAGAIVVGTGTVLADNPTLTARAPDGTLYADQPIPIVIGERDIPTDALLHAHPRSLSHIRTHDISAALEVLYRDGIRSVYVEGGPTLVSAFVAAGVVDRYYLFMAPQLLGGSKSALEDIHVTTLSESVKLQLDAVTFCGPDLFITAYPADSHSSATSTSAPPIPKSEY